MKERPSFLAGMAFTQISGDDFCLLLFLPLPAFDPVIILSIYDYFYIVLPLRIFVAQEDTGLHMPRDSRKIIILVHAVWELVKVGTCYLEID